MLVMHQIALVNHVYKWVIGVFAHEDEYVDALDAAQHFAIYSPRMNAIAEEEWERWQEHSSDEVDEDLGRKLARPDFLYQAIPDDCTAEHHDGGFVAVLVQAYTDEFYRG